MEFIKRRHAWLAALLLAVCAQTLFGLGVTRVDHPVFDETHYLPAARHIVSMDRPVNEEHPLAGKTAIAAGIAVFGDDPLGWRIMSTVAGTIAVLGVFALTLVLFGSTATAACAAVIAALNGMLYVQARIAMPDVFLCAYVVWGLTFAAMAVRSPRPVPRIVAAGVLLGLATATKWMAAPILAAVCIGLPLIRRRDLRLTALTGKPLEEARKAHLGGRSPWLLAIVTGTVAIATYFATFWPAFLYDTGALGGLGDLVALQKRMYELQTQVLTPHTYQSGWIGWAFDARPIWYLFEGYYGGERGIVMIANPATAALGLLGTAVCLTRWWRTHDARMAVAAGMWLFAWAMFAAIPKSIGFMYYFVPASILQAVAVAAALHRDDGRYRGMMIVAVGIAAVGFAVFHPIYSGRTMPMGWYERLMWSERWR